MTSTDITYKPSMLIDGQEVASEDFFDVENPSTGDIIANVPVCSREQLDAAFAAAERAFPGWAATPIDQRSAALIAAADRLAEHVEDLTLMVAQELGKPLELSRFEVTGLIAYLRRFAGERIDDVVLTDNTKERIVVTHAPVGVVAAITPWNGPMFMFALKLAPALLAGNALVVKPSPFTPIATLHAARIIADIFPAGVLNVIAGPEPLGAWMVSHPVPRKVTFTGSIPVGKAIASAAGADLKKVTLELGGNDAAIVLPDADVDKIAGPIFTAAFANTGQACLALKRLYVVGDAYDEVVKAIAAKAREAVVGDPLDPSTVVGPLATPQQRAHVEDLIADARAHGGRIVTGGSRIDRPGYFHELTVVADVTDGVRIVDEEQFGPVLPIVRCDSIDDAVSRANGTMFGLGASVWGSDLDEARMVAARLDAGTVWINGHRTSSIDRPLTGWKWSGVGVEKGTWGIEAMCELKVIHEIRS